MPAAISPGGSGTSRMIESEVTDLPLPDSPTIASVSPAPKREADAIDRAGDFAVGMEQRLQVR